MKEKTMSIDSNILGKWKHNTKNEVLLFDSGGHYFFGTLDVPFVLQNNYTELVINSITTYARIGTNTNSIVGHWRDNGSGEEVYYRADGRYITLFDNEAIVYFGTYSVNNSKITGYDFRAMFETSSGNLIQYVYGTTNVVSTPYSVSGNTLTLGGVVYNKIN